MGEIERRARSKRAITIALFVSVVASAAIFTTPALASSIQVYVGYADSLRADATNFPTPWLGSPNTTFIGCVPTPSSPCEYDGAAIRVVNNGASAATVNSIALHIDSCTYIWPSAALPAGGELILTQLESGADDGCTGPTPNHVDASDIGSGGAPNSGDCTPDGVVPTVDVTVNGTTTSYADSAQVLNTAGVDMNSCPGNPNESIQWSLIGTSRCVGSQLTLSPPAQTHPVLSTAQLTATFENGCGQPLSDALINFAAIAGVNPTVSGSGVTNASGQATFSYSSSKVGTDTFRATLTNLVGTILSNTATVTWTVSFAPGGGGAFVISDLRDISGASVYWWGAQWWKNDHLSTGLAPASFKGYENGNASPWCGQTWTTRPGNSPKPPKAVPANSYMAVIVASRVTQRGSTISGNIVHIVLVRTNRGYGPNPGHPGTGTIILTLC